MSDELYKEVKETEKEVAKNPPKDEKIILEGDEARDVRQTEKEVGKKVDVQLSKDTDKCAVDSDGAPIADEDSVSTGAVDAVMSRRAENTSSDATHNDTGIFPQP